MNDKERVTGFKRALMKASVCLKNEIQEGWKGEGTVTIYLKYPAA